MSHFFQAENIIEAVDIARNEAAAAMDDMKVVHYAGSTNVRYA